MPDFNCQCLCFFFFKQKTAYEIRPCDWSSDVCSSDLRWLIVKDRLPRPAVIDGFKNAAVHRRHVKNIRLRRNTADRARSPAAVRSNVPPAQNRIELSRARLT